MEARRWVTWESTAGVGCCLDRRPAQAVGLDVRGDKGSWVTMEREGAGEQTTLDQVCNLQLRWSCSARMPLSGSPHHALSLPLLAVADSHPAQGPGAPPPPPPPPRALFHPTPLWLGSPWALDSSPHLHWEPCRGGLGAVTVRTSPGQLLSPSRGPL